MRWSRFRIFLQFGESALNFGAIFFIIGLGIYLVYEYSDYFDTVKDNLRRVSETIRIDSGQTLSVEYPARVLYDAPPQEVRVTRWTTATLSNPLTLTVVALNKSLVISNTAYIIRDISILTNKVTSAFTSTSGIILTPTTGTIPTTTTITLPVSITGLILTPTVLISEVVSSQLVFAPIQESVQTFSFYVSNAHTVPDNLLPEYLRIEALDFTQTFTIPIEVEGARSSTRRAFMSNTLTENSALIIVLSALGSFVAFGLNYVQQQERERKEQVEKNERETKAQIQFNKIREALIKANAAQAHYEFEIFLQSKENLREFIIASDVEYAQKLVQVAEGNNDNLEDLVRTSRWPKETVGALIAQGNNQLNIHGRRILLNAINIFLSLRQSEITEEKQQSLRDLIAKWEESLKRPRKLSWKTNYWEPRRLLAEEIGISQRLKYSPFGHEHAEDDGGFLFGETGGFWSGHPIYVQIASDMIPQVIIGEEGCGKTAFAYALKEIGDPNGGSREILPVCISGQPKVTEIQQDVAKELLKFICGSPFTLTFLGNHEQLLLTRQLCISLGYEFVQASIENAKRTRPPSESEPWRTENLLQLNTLERTLEKNKMATWSEASDWLKLTQLSIFALDFKFIVISLDVSQCKMDYVHELLSLMRQWASCNLVIKLFLPHTVPKLRRSTHNLKFVPLTWTKTDIEELAKWRFDTAIRLSGTRANIEDVFEGDIYSQFIKCSRYNPRCLAMLWRYLFEEHMSHSPDQLTFSQANFDHAMKKLD